jgi:hypothetical protein
MPHFTHYFIAVLCTIIPVYVISSELTWTSVVFVVGRCRRVVKFQTTCSFVLRTYGYVRCHGSTLIILPCKERSTLLASHMKYYYRSLKNLRALSDGAFGTMHALEISRCEGRGGEVGTPLE